MNGLEKYPKLRFKGFSEPWHEIVIGDLFKVTRGYVLPTTAVKEEPQDEYIFPVYSSQTKNEGLMGYYNQYLYENAITWTTDGANAGTVHYRDGKFYCTNVCGVLLNEDGNANRCIAEILGSISKKYVSYVGNPKLMNNVMSEIRIHVPSVSEQKKIDEFISALDLRITKQRDLIEHLKKYKRGIIKEFLTPQTCPIKNAVWNEAPIGELGTFVKGAPLSKADISDEGTPFILYGELYTTYGEVINKVVRRTQKNVDNVYLSRIGDVLIPTSGETPEEISTASCVMVSGVILAGDLNIFRTSKVDGRIMSYVLNHIVNGNIARIAQGKSVVHIQASEISKISISYPDKNTQQQLITVFDGISEKIALAEESLAKMIMLKKSLIQKMFI